MASSLDRVVVSSSDKFAAAGVLLCSPFGVTAAFCAASVCGCVTAGASGGMDQQFLKDFIAGGTSGCIAKCATAPIERRKLVTQLTSSPTGLRLAASLAASADGPVPMPGPVNPWAGNLINCFRYFPTQACNFAFKDAIKAMFPKVNKKENFSAFFAVNMLSGGLAGALSLLFVYPLDFARTLLAIDTHGASELPDHTIWLLAGMISVDRPAHTVSESSLRKSLVGWCRVLQRCVRLHDDGDRCKRRWLERPDQPVLWLYDIVHRHHPVPRHLLWRERRP
jgi:hypothetical protein